MGVRAMKPGWKLEALIIAGDAIAFLTGLATIIIGTIFLDAILGG